MINMTPILNIKDKKILYELDLDARQSFQEIGKKVGLSKEVVNYRIKKMEESGIIKGYYTLINMSKLGNICNRFVFKFRNTDKNKETEIINYFVKNPKYWWVDSCDGFRDMGVGSWEKDLSDCYKRREELLNKYKTFLEDFEQSFYTQFYIYKRTYLSTLKTKETKPILYISNRIYKIDNIDEKILLTIAGNARMSTIDIANKINVTPIVVKYRLKKLKSEHIIEGFRPIIDLSKIGYYWYKIEFNLKDYTKKKEMLDFFSIHPNIIYAYETTAQSDLEVELETSSYEEFRKILDEIKSKFSDAIESYKHLLWYKEHKITFPVSD